MPRHYARRLQTEPRFSERFVPCMAAAMAHLAEVETLIERLARAGAQVGAGKDQVLCATKISEYQKFIGFFAFS